MKVSKKSPSKPLKIFLSVAFCLYFISSCKTSLPTQNTKASTADKTTVPQQDLVKDIINSFSPNGPQMSLPKDTDPNGDDWKGIDLEAKQPVKPLYVSEEAQRFILPPGYHIEPVLTEPAIQQPGAIAFDGNGRMYVLELRSYMLTADSKDELEPTSRISRWEDKDNDGVYETGTTFIDNLIFPRFVLPYGKDCVLTMESDADNVYKYTDTDGDGKADKKELFTNKYGRSGNVEHQQAFMYWGMDNWLYSTVNAFRVRETPGGVIREKTGFNRAQWGITHDDDGKLWFQGGASGLPSYFQFPIHYGNFEVPGEFAKGFDIPYGAAVKISDMQGGMDEIRQPDGSLKRVTGSAGNDVYRGDRLPESLRGQYFYGEPVARIVRQINPVVKEGLTTLHNVYQDQQSEFLRSSDPLFRPVDMATAPDGTMYIVDMYHGIIQEGQWTQKGTYLRTKIEQYQLDKVVGLGRIWRITYNGKERDKNKPKMLNEKTSALVKHLEHPNGWWRDAAQQLIVLRQDKSVVPALEKMALNNPNVLARIHAIWALEGLNALKTETAQKLLSDANPRIRIQALRAGETLYKNGQKELEASYKAALGDADTDVTIQAMLSSKFLKLPDLEANIKTTVEKNKAAGVKLVGEQIIKPPRVTRGLGLAAELSKDQQEMLNRGAVIYNELCSQCHGNSGQGTPAGDGKLLAPALAGSSRIQSHPEYAIRVVLHGMDGAIEGKTYAGGMMASMKEQPDQWVADVISYIRNGLSNDASLVSADVVAKIRQKTADQPGMYKFDNLIKLVPHELQQREGWKVTASNTASTRIGGNVSPTTAFTYEGWSTGTKQEKGMWYQIEFPKETAVSEIQFNSAAQVKRGWVPKPNTPPGQRPMVQTHPRMYTVETSSDGTNWQPSISAHKGNDGDNIIALTPRKAKFIRIKLDQGIDNPEDDIPWTMKQFKIFELNQ